jgi:hypothetical protein
MEEKPLGQAFVICDQIITEAGSNKKSLIGVFNTIGCFTFPAQHPHLSLYCAITNGRGVTSVTLKCVRTDDSFEVVRIDGHIDLVSPNEVVELIFNLNNLPFERSGLYVFELSCGGEYVMEKRFNVLQLTPPAQHP